jgi:hypothetical protein
MAGKLLETGEQAEPLAALEAVVLRRRPADLAAESDATCDLATPLYVG